MIASTSRPTLIMGAVAVAALSFTACGGSGGGNSAGDVEAFCAKYEEFDNAGDIDSNDDILDALDVLKDIAPAEISNDLDTAIDAFKTLSEFEEKFDAGEEIDEEDASLVEASEQIDTTGEKIEDYVAANCGLES